MILCVDAYSDGTIAGAYYECVSCKSDSPYIEDADDIKSEAHAAALRRWVEPNMVLTWDEFVERIKLYPVWLEDKTRPRCSEWVNPDEEPYTEWEFETAKQAYGKYARAWLRRPTDEEREAVAWE